MLRALLVALAAFVIVFGVLRGAEALYHRLRRTADWSPHWGSWVFAVLIGLYAFLTNLGR